MAGNNKVVTYHNGDGSYSITSATQEQVEALRDSGRLMEVRRVRHFRKFKFPRR